MWERYCRGVQAIVFVVDAADLESIDDAAKELHNLLERPNLEGIPLLVIGNKIDLGDALSSDELIASLHLKVRHTTYILRNKFLFVLSACRLPEAYNSVCVLSKSRLLHGFARLQVF